MDAARAAEYNEGPYSGVPEQALKSLAALEPNDPDAGAVAAAIVKVVGMAFAKRPFRIHVDPSEDGAEVVNGVADRVRAEMFRRIGLDDLLKPAFKLVAATGALVQFGTRGGHVHGPWHSKDRSHFQTFASGATRRVGPFACKLFRLGR
jgi:hypothetical protein